MRNRRPAGRRRGAAKPLRLEPVRRRRPRARGPVEGLGAGHPAHEIAAFHRRHPARPVHQIVGVDGAGGDDPAHRPRGTQLAGQRARVDSADGHDPVVGQVIAQRPARTPPVARDRRHLADGEPGDLGTAGLDVLDRDPVVADLGAGHGDDLPGIGRIGQHLLIPGHARVEHDLAQGHAGRPGRGAAVPASVLKGKDRVHRGSVVKRCGRAGLGGGDLYGVGRGPIPLPSEPGPVGVGQRVRHRRRRVADEPPGRTGAPGGRVSASEAPVSTSVRGDGPAGAARAAGGSAGSTVRSALNEPNRVVLVENDRRGVRLVAGQGHPRPHRSRTADPPARTGSCRVTRR